VPTLRDIKRRIGSVKSTQQITKAMKMVASVKLRRAQERMMRARPYSRSLDEMLGHVAAKIDRSLHPLLAEREPKSICYVVITGDRGLAGSFNSNITRRAKSEIDGQVAAGQSVSAIAVGRKGYEFLHRRGYRLLEKYINFFNELDFHHAQDIGELIKSKFIGEELDRIYLIYNEFKSAIQQRIVVQQLLPIVPRPPAEEKYHIDFLLEPSPRAILDTLCPKYLNIEIWQALLESYAAEMGARTAAMDAATENAQEMIYQLTLNYNKARQAAITKELSEIVGGAEALSKA
jgi:F-type H+-transporting ATPase subunit gamma